MKKYIVSALVTAVFTALVPALPVFLGKNSVSAENFTAEYSNDGVYKVLDVPTGEVLEVPVREYVIGAVCAEMPATFEEEALKAQAVAAHTYAERQKSKELKNPTPELCGAYFSNDTSKYQGYFTEKQAKQYYGENFGENYKKVSKAVDEVIDCIITYDEEPIISAFHSMSSGKTESAENAWGTSVDYLVPVDSSYDRSAPKYEDTVTYEKDVLKYKLETAFPSVNLSENIEDWVTVNSVSDSGTVLTAMAGDLKVSGNDIRSALSLRSACFTVEYSGETAVFTTHGFGHGVGMSQYGANAMAEEGKNWRDIIEHYYPSCTICNVQCVN